MTLTRISCNVHEKPFLVYAVKILLIFIKAKATRVFLYPSGVNAPRRKHESTGKNAKEQRSRIYLEEYTSDIRGIIRSSRDRGHRLWGQSNATFQASFWHRAKNPSRHIDPSTSSHDSAHVETALRKPCVPARSFHRFFSSLFFPERARKDRAGTTDGITEKLSHTQASLALEKRRSRDESNAIS